MQEDITVRLPNNWSPRDYQKPFLNYYLRGGKRGVAVWHRRAGKDDCCLHLTAMMAHDRVAPYWHMLPEAAQARKAIWNAVNPHTGRRRIEEAFPDDLIANRNEQEMFIRFHCGSTYQVVGSDNFNSLVGSSPAGVIYSEWALANPAARTYLKPILKENGGWEAYIYTPRGRNHGLATYQIARDDPNSFAQILTAEDTSIFTEQDLTEELKELQKLHGLDHGKALWMQEYYCSFDAPILGAIYGSYMERAEREGRIVRGLYDKTLPVYTAWDLGYSDNVAIWFFQIFNGRVRFIDYHTSNGKDPKYYCDFIKSKVYEYARHYVPQDATRKVLEAGGKSFVQQAFAEGVKMFVVPETTHLNRHTSTRVMLDQAYFDPEFCGDGIEALRNYHYEWDDDKKIFSLKPYHDWSSHGSTACELAARIYKDPPKEESTQQDEIRGLHNCTADEVFWPETSSHKRERI